MIFQSLIPVQALDNQWLSFILYSPNTLQKTEDIKFQ